MEWKKNIVVLFLVIPSALSIDWCYSGDDCLKPDHWSEEFAECTGSHQSPISIWLSDLHIKGYSDRKYGIQLHNYDELQNFTMVNNGRSVIVTPQADYSPSFTAGHLPGKYKLKQFHFHWGMLDMMGSEHTTGHTPYQLELHLVHVNEATDKIEAVLAVFYQLVEHNQDTDSAKGPLEAIATHLLPNLVKPSGTASVSNIHLSHLLPANMDNYIYYTGSLTTPPCSEGIHWTIFTQVQNVTKRQIGYFRNLTTFNGKGSLGNNFRPTQKLTHREVVLFAYQTGSITGRISIILVLLSVLSTCRPLIGVQ